MPNSRPDVGLHKDDVGKLTELFTNINANISNKAVIPELSTIDKPSFVKCYDSALKLINKEILAAGGDQKLYDLVEDTFFNLFTKDTGIRDKRGEFTGISFFGYGGKEIFPSLYRIHVYNCINGIIYWRMIEYNKIENMGNQSYICPMAQIDEMQTYITGINPVIEDTLISGIESIMREFLAQLATSIHSHNPVVAKNIAQFDITPLISQYKKNIQDFKQTKNIDPLINTVSTMAKEDLAELAENLIYMTSLKRHITPNLESVGGPVDVAVISKGDGFIWMKRKHYFDPSLNKCFFDNYYGSNIK